MAVVADNEAYVRALWAAFARDGVRGMRELAGPDVEWVPWSADGDVLAGSARLEELYGASGDRGGEVSATVHAFECHGQCVMAHGSLRMFRVGGFLDVQPSWVYFFRDGRLVRAAAYATRETALAAINAFRAAE